MTGNWEGQLDRHLAQWTAAGLLDADSATRIRAWESTRPRGLSWPVRMALAFGAILLGAGVLLLVSAHWDQLSPAGRMSLVVGTVAALHAGGAAVARRFEGLSVALHAVGSIAMGGGIALAGQIFNLSEHWPEAILLWAAGCGFAWLLLRHWTQGALCAILIPWWLAGEWDTRVAFAYPHGMMPVWAGVCALSFAYMSSRRSPEDGTLRKALAWLGGLTLLPAAALVASYGLWERGDLPWGPGGSWIAWAVALVGPLAVALALDKRQVLWCGAAMAWTLVLAVCGSAMQSQGATYAWCAIGAAGLTAWGIRFGRAERINLGVAGFAIAVFAFYFSSVMDKMGRSASLIGIGLLFLAGGWVLEKARRRLLAQM